MRAARRVPRLLPALLLSFLVAHPDLAAASASRVDPSGLQAGSHGAHAQLGLAHVGLAETPTSRYLETRIRAFGVLGAAGIGLDASPSPCKLWFCELAWVGQTSGKHLALLVHNALPCAVSPLPSKAGGTAAGYNKATGQGLYVLEDPATNQILYVGRGDAPARLARHANDPTKALLRQRALWNNNLTKAEAKGLEQMLIERFGGAQSTNPLTQLLNKINSFAKTNPNRTTYRRGVTHQLWKETLRRVGPL